MNMNNSPSQSSLVVGYLGPSGSHSQQALKILRPGYEEKPYPFFKPLFQALESGDVDLVIVPIENSLEGGVSVVMEILGSGRYPVKIVSEFDFSISHALMSKSDGTINTVVSHPQALGQCRETLKEKFGEGLNLQQASSTSEAARIVSETSETGWAALATQQASEDYNLKILLDNASDSTENQTRFLLVTHQECDVPPILHQERTTISKKTSLCLGLKDRPGVLVDILLVFKAYGVNLTRIESRPSRKKMGDYLFYLDTDSELTEEQFDKVRMYLSAETNHLQIMGPYNVFGKLG